MIVVAYYRNKKTQQIEGSQVYSYEKHPLNDWNYLKDLYNEQSENDVCEIVFYEQGTIEYYLAEQSEQLKQLPKDDLQEVKMYLSEAMDIIVGLM